MIYTRLCSIKYGYVNQVLFFDYKLYLCENETIAWEICYALSFMQVVLYAYEIILRPLSLHDTISFRKNSMIVPGKLIPNLRASD